MQGRGWGKEGPVSPTAKRGPADDLNVFDDVNTRLVRLGQDVLLSMMLSGL